MVSDATEIDIKTAGEFARENYLSVHHGVVSWLLTKDHKRIGLLYLFTILIFFLIASVAAALMRIELVTPQPKLVTSETFFFQAEDGIRDVAVTGVQTCALPI